MIYGTLHIHITTFLLIHGIVGVALLLAPTFANALWNKGGWIQNRANTLATWCMFAQVFPLFQVDGIFATLPVLYKYTGAATGMVFITSH